MSMKDAYIQKLQGKLDEMKAEMDRLKAKAEQGAADAEIERERQQRLEEVRARRAELENKLDDLRDAGEQAWEDLKSGAEKASSAMSQALQSARERF